MVGPCAGSSQSVRIIDYNTSGELYWRKYAVNPVVVLPIEPCTALVKGDRRENHRSTLPGHVPEVDHSQHTPEPNSRATTCRRKRRYMDLCNRRQLQQTTINALKGSFGRSIGANPGAAQKTLRTR
jgi:hypothetical protein